MKKLIFTCIFLIFGLSLQAQFLSGNVVVDSIYSTLLGNSGGEHPTRKISVYLPPGYYETNERYPVIYFLHGFTLDNQTMFAWADLETKLNVAINTKKIRPVILVVSDQNTTYRGSFYTNSSLTGKWADFTATDVVKYVDQNFRTLSQRESRGVAGHSMGGHGAIKMGMLYPEVFSSVYAHSPAVLGLAKELGPKGIGYRRAPMITSHEELVDGFKEFHPNVVVALGRAFSPNPEKPPFYADLPYEYQDDELIVNEEVLELWMANCPIEMLDEYASNLEKLKAFKLDWGRNEEHLHIPFTCRIFSEKMEIMGIDHFAEEYLGTHSNRINSEEGRILHQMLPFFNRFLSFEEEVK
ncbi:alpha/beta hydrolase [Flexithrix dorotheae]|uniref:alpha/beta hydrolase n=1 Tax=Flexithrix dorotheae TaxID=70993 RepID=UPI000378C925|nr:alpha/beta hydrolase-fold protein [Flexithrix dorotheae]